MAYRGIQWRENGFTEPPSLEVAPAGGVLLYRCWGLRTASLGSFEWPQGNGFFTLIKPVSVADAERRLNIVEYGNAVHFVSTFRLKSGFHYWLGTVAHNDADLATKASQVLVESPLAVKLELVRSRDILRHDVFVSPRNGNA